MTYKIEKDVPRKAGRFPFSKMEVGDSFYVGDILNRSVVYNAATRAGYKISTQTEGDGYRVWLAGRIEE